MPKISVILSSYNHEKFIRESIESTLNQTFADFELIIWDDASSDSSWHIISQYSDPRIKAYRNEINLRGIVGINKAISEVASGEYIAIHHSDDVWELNKLQEQVDFLDANPNIGAVFTNTQPIGEQGAPLSDQTHAYYSIFNQPNRSRHEWLHHFFFRGNALCHPSVLIRKECYENCGLYRFGLPQLADFDLWIRLCFKYDIHVLPERLVKFRVRDNEANSSGNRPEVRIRDRSEFHHILKHFLRISTFNELVSIFPEAEKYYRLNGCEPRFVFSMVALGENALPGAKFLGMETLFDLITDVSTSAKIKSLYQFDYHDFISLTGKFDLFSLETVANQSWAIAEFDAIISSQTKFIAQLTESIQTAGTVKTNQQTDHADLPQASAALRCKIELSADRDAYEQAAHLLESDQHNEGLALLEALAEKGSTCWDVYNDLAVLHINDGDHLRAAPYFHKGIALEGKSGTTARNFATMLLMTGEMAGALAVLGSILREQPHDAGVLDVIRDILSGINPIAPDTWLKLVSDLRGEQWSEPVKLADEAKSEHHDARRFSCSMDTIEEPLHNSTFSTGLVCPVCKSGNVSFIAIPEIYRENAYHYGYAHFGKMETISLDTYTCSKCGASDRERLYALWIDQQIEQNCFFRNMRVIHFAPETALSNKLKVYGLFNYKTSDLLMSNVDYQVDMMDMPFEDESFDFFICSHVLEHVESDDQAIHELYRITVSGGRGILMAPIAIELEKTVEDPSVKDPAGRWKLYGQDDHVRLYAHDDYVNKISSHGFHVEELGESYFGADVFRSLGLARTSILYVVSK